jgi:hypothetical protein
MKFILIISIVFLFSCTKNNDLQQKETGSDCMLMPFTATYFEKYNSKDVYFVKGKVLKNIYYGNQIKIIEDFKGNFEGNAVITVWADDGASNRADNMRLYNKNDTLLLLLKQTDMQANRILNRKYEKKEDFMTCGCSFSVLKLSEGYVTGKIYFSDGSLPDKTMLWSDLQKQLNE